jgi:hypothetical protein
MLTFFLGLITIVFLGFLLTQMPLVQKTNLGYKYIFAFFTIKVIAGFVIGYVAYHYYSPQNDYWDNNFNSGVEYEVLKNNPRYFFKEVLFSNYGNYNDFFGHGNSFWNDLKQNLLIKALAPFHFFTKGNYYLLSIFFNAFIFLGFCLWYRLLLLHFKPSKILIFCAFLAPSFLFFGSGIHRDGLVFCFVVACLHCFYHILAQQKQIAKYVIVIILSLALLLLLRNYIAVTLSIALVTWYFSNKYPNKSNAITGLVIAGFIAFFVATILLGVPTPINILIAKQTDYFNINTNNQNIIAALQPTIKSFLSNSVTAFKNTLLPNFSAKLNCLFSVELLLLLFFTISVLIKQKVKNTPFGAAITVFCILSLFIIGHITPNYGALIRYRSFFLIFWLGIVGNTFYQHFKYNKK